MLLIKNFSLASAALCCLLESSLAVPHQPARIVKRDEPDFILNWDLFRRWQHMQESIAEMEVPEIDDVTMAEWDPSTKTLTWECYTLVMGAQIAGVAAVINKATLDPYPEPTVITKRSSGEANQVIYGASLQKKCSINPNVLAVIDYVYSEGRRNYGWSIMPYISEGSLETNFDSYPDQSSINAAFKQMLNAVAGVQSEGIIHRDIKPENFLKDGDTLKLMDFDQSRETSSSAQFDVGTPSYIAPEIIAMKSDTGTTYDYKVDTFSIAMSFMVMSVSELRDSTTRFQLWKDLIEPDGKTLWPSAATVATLLKARNYAVFSGNDDLLNVLAKALCKPSERYDPQGFKAAFATIA
ncbi:serine/threonine protein kinase [Penicillium maclennaniae]|uniref:serine/threonine protein kinase n=1 Tax=Penicillium maclennaniae TaxID=1343394 RepID=UPI0025409DB2|nr:serine/threonine protein kinase [Penicillium maclennaniae]KAJ5681735.1 serine/threonine protein kinase [Penicillium maclennaniae]